MDVDSILGQLKEAILLQTDKDLGDLRAEVNLLRETNRRLQKDNDSLTSHMNELETSIEELTQYSNFSMVRQLNTQNAELVREKATLQRRFNLLSEQFNLLKEQQRNPIPEPESEPVADPTPEPESEPHEPVLESRPSTPEQQPALMDDEQPHLNLVLAELESGTYKWCPETTVMWDANGDEVVDHFKTIKLKNGNRVLHDTSDNRLYRYPTDDETTFGPAAGYIKGKKASFFKRGSKTKSHTQ